VRPESFPLRPDECAGWRGEDLDEGLAAEGHYDLTIDLKRFG
jgi:hypothetical protein